MLVVWWVGNIGLLFLIKFVSGYWYVFDLINGFVVIYWVVYLCLLDELIVKWFFFEMSLLIYFNIIWVMVVDVLILVCYGEELLNLSVVCSLFEFLLKFFYYFCWCVLFCYFFFDINVVIVFFVVGVILFFLGVGFVIYCWYEGVMSGVV